MPSLSQFETNELATYNAERTRGIVHTPKWVERMLELQSKFDGFHGFCTVPPPKPMVPPKPPKERCASCCFYHVDEIRTEDSRLCRRTTSCRRFPQKAAKSDDDWCGEYKFGVRCGDVVPTPYAETCPVCEGPLSGVPNRMSMSELAGKRYCYKCQTVWTFGDTVAHP